MITGIVNAGREAVIQLKVSWANGQEQLLDAVIDTGFTGSLTLPSTVIAALNLPFHSRQPVILGDGNVYSLDVYTGTVEWDGQLHRIEIDMADTTPLVGMAMMYGYKLTVEAVDGGKVTIELLLNP